MSKLKPRQRVPELELPLFNEPGLFLVRPDMTLQYVAFNSGPRGRPGIDDMLASVAFMIETSAPARDEA